MRRPARWRRRVQALAACGAVLTAAGPARAIVGTSSAGGSLAASMVMVLNRAGPLVGFCSGIVVAQNAVLTAAHCVPPGAALKVHYRDNATPVLLDVADVARNPGYRADAIAKRLRSIDLALVRLEKPLPDAFRPASLAAAAPETAPGTAFRLAGFGVRREGEGTSSGTLRVAEIAAHPPQSAVLLWAADPTGHGGGACTGDSGGAVLGPNDTVVAVIAWSAGVGAARCGALTQAIWVAPQQDWIAQVLWRWSEQQ